MQDSSTKEYDNKVNKRSAILKTIRTIFLDVIFLAFCVFCAFYEFPYYIYTTGGSVNLKDRISAPQGYDYAGSYSMNYVTVVRGKLPMLLVALIRSDWDIVKEENIVIPNTSYEDTLTLERIELQNSLNQAKVIAFNKANIPYEITNKKCRVYYVNEQAKTDIEVLDELISYDGIAFTELSALQTYVNSFEVGHKFTFEVKDKEGKLKTRTGTSIKIDDKKVIGVSLLNSFDISSEMDIDITTKESEAGSSGGLMLTLAIYDAITKDDLTKGRTIMGTGTIESDGSVGEIGGVKYKMLGAEKDGADVFFIPPANYEEAKKVYKEHELSFDLVMVNNFDEAIAYLTS